MVRLDSLANEVNFLTARQFAESLMKQGFITKTEFKKIDDLLIAAFAPLIGKLITVSLDKPEDQSE
ncbi:SHOCT domain-containing protein [Succinimonas sp.]|uniref:SHOCT domain-containing protein n=1 Tax=Succinimonas sp. TaxID=1936151 RepID=UPI003869DADB